MSQNNWKKHSIKKQLDTVLLKESLIDIAMSDEILNQIKYLCKTIPKVEWSGVLFYSITGSIEKPAEMKVVLEDILPMDKGSAAYTEYHLGDEYMDYLMEDESRMDWHVGHIHSHNTMGVFFSGTDMEELEDNSEAHNIYLSLIVNNYMDFTAKVAFRGKVESQVTKIPYMALNELGQEYIIETATFDISKEKMYVYDCTVNSKKESVIVPDEFVNRVKHILKPKVPDYTKKGLPQYGAGFQSNNKNYGKNGNYKKKGKQKTLPFGDMGNWWKNKHKQADPNLTEDHSPTEIFMLSLFSFSDEVEATDTLGDLLEGIMEIGLEVDDIVDVVIRAYVEKFEEHFPLFDDEGKQFILITNEVIALMDEEVEAYPILEKITVSLSNMLVKFKEYAK